LILIVEILVAIWSIGLKITNARLKV